MNPKERMNSVMHDMDHPRGLRIKQFRSRQKFKTTAPELF